MTSGDTSLAAALGRRQFARLTTFRKNSRPVATTIWFALSEGRAYFLTDPETGKAKRIRNNPRVQIGPSTALGKPVGAEVPGAARWLAGDDAEAARRALAAKYGFQLALLGVYERLRRLRRVYFEIRPA